MTVYRISSCRFIEDISGYGAFLYGGRWNSEGVHMLYTASNLSLAMLESLVHFGGRIMGSYCRIALQIPDTSILKITEKDLPENWRDTPAPDVLKKVGDDFAREGKYLTLSIPSVIVPDECNYLINPLHPDFKKVKIMTRSLVTFDDRLIGRS